MVWILAHISMNGTERREWKSGMGSQMSIWADVPCGPIPSRELIKSHCIECQCLYSLREWHFYLRRSQSLLKRKQDGKVKERERHRDRLYCMVRWIIFNKDWDMVIADPVIASNLSRDASDQRRRKAGCYLHKNEGSKGADRLKRESDRWTSWCCRRSQKQVERKDSCR